MTIDYQLIRLLNHGLAHLYGQINEEYNRYPDMDAINVLELEVTSIKEELVTLGYSPCELPNEYYHYMNA